jgi:hypothetical protein
MKKLKVEVMPQTQLPNFFPILASIWKIAFFPACHHCMAPWSGRCPYSRPGRGVDSHNSDLPTTERDLPVHQGRGSLKTVSPEPLTQSPWASESPTPPPPTDERKGGRPGAAAGPQAGLPVSDSDHRACAIVWYHLCAIVWYHIWYHKFLIWPNIA